LYDVLVFIFKFKVQFAWRKFTSKFILLTFFVSLQESYYIHQSRVRHRPFVYIRKCVTGGWPSARS